MHFFPRFLMVCEAGEMLGGDLETPRCKGQFDFEFTDSNFGSLRFTFLAIFLLLSYFL